MLFSCKFDDVMILAVHGMRLWILNHYCNYRHWWIWSIQW